MLLGSDRLGEARRCTMLLDLSKQATKPLRCHDCDINMRFLASVHIKRGSLSTIIKRKFFLCPNCGRLSSVLVAMHQRQSSSAAAAGSSPSSRRIYRSLLECDHASRGWNHRGM